MSDREIVYVGGVCNHQGADTAVSLLKLTFTTPDKDTVIPEDLGIFTTPESALKAAGIGHYHRVAGYIFDYFTDDDELDETLDEEPPSTPAV